MEPTAPPEPAANEPQPASDRVASGDARGAQGGVPAPRPEEPKRRRPTAAERRFAGYGDGIERARCAAQFHRIPPGFPVQRRVGVATLPARPVARRPDAILLCDGAHPGPHRWPDGDEPTEAEQAVEPPG